MGGGERRRTETVKTLCWWGPCSVGWLSNGGGRSGRQSGVLWWSCWQMSLDVAALQDWQGEIDDLRKEPSKVTGLRRPGKEVILAALSLQPRLQITFIWCYSKTLLFQLCSLLKQTQTCPRHINIPIFTFLRGTAFCLFNIFLFC